LSLKGYDDLCNCSIALLTNWTCIRRKDHVKFFKNWKCRYKI